EIKLLVKSPDGSYAAKKISECGEKLDMYQSIRYFIRVFVKPTALEMISEQLSSKLEDVKTSVCEKY
ncbi:phosphohydrolase, partial [Vibrio parahaemolyticus]|nr:phosphohydrolase [Vibrio parahaemolyticus]